MLILHNLIRFAYTRSRSSLWLAAAKAADAQPGPAAQPGRPVAAELARDPTRRLPRLLLTAPCGLMFALRFFAPGPAPAEQTAAGDILLIVISGLLLLFVNTLPLNIITYALVALAGLSMLLVSAYHWQKGYRPARLFVAAMVVFNIGTLIILPALLGLTLVEPQGLIITLLASSASAAC
jgi:hypothetical protein